MDRNVHSYRCSALEASCHCISLQLDDSNQNIKPFQLQFAQSFPTKTVTIAKQTISIFTIDIYRPVVVLDGCQVGSMYALHEQLEAKDKFSRTPKVCLFLSIHSNRTMPLFEQHNRRPPNPPAAHILTIETKNRSILVAHKDLGPSILSEVAI